MHENSDQDNPVCSQSPSECQSRSWLLYGFPPGHYSTVIAFMGLPWHCPFSLPMVLACMDCWALLDGKLFHKADSGVLLAFFLLPSSLKGIIFLWSEKCSSLSRSLIFLDGWFLKQMEPKLPPFFPVASLGFTLPWVFFNRPPVFSIRQVTCLMCIVSVRLWCHIILYGKKQELNKCHINWTDFREFLALFRELTCM